MDGWMDGGVFGWMVDDRVWRVDGWMKDGWWVNE